MSSKLLLFLFKKLGIRNKVLFYEYLGALLAITATAVTIPEPGAITVGLAVDGITTAGYMVLRQDKK